MGGTKEEQNSMVAITKTEQEVPEAPYDWPNYTRGERIADGTIHAIGIVGSILAFYYLFSFPGLIDANLVPALIVYAVCSIALFCFSALYHLAPWPHRRPFLRRVDQAAIFFKIAGTYTPLVFLVDTLFGYSLLTAVWIAASVGAISKLMTGDRLDSHTVTIYLGLSWSSALLLWQLVQTLDFWSVWFVVLGGILYTIGVIFHQWDGLKFQNAIWHAFVLVASACHFTAVASAAF